MIIHRTVNQIFFYSPHNLMRIERLFTASTKARCALPHSLYGYLLTDIPAGENQHCRVAFQLRYISH